MNLTAGKRIFFLIAFSLSACDNGSNYAPVADVADIEPIPKTGMHKAQQNETLYEVAWRYGLDYRDVAARNRVDASYKVKSGQFVYLEKPTQNSFAINKKSVVKNVFAKPIKSFKTKEPNFVVKSWQWPVKGRVDTSYSAKHKGINIQGNAGDPIFAAAPGKVVYCGDGLRGYGKLIILKHNSLYLSAYAHNQAVYVKEGDWVKQGQKIAEMGQTGTDKVMLHFEIRRAGLPINPVSLLNA